MIFPHPLMAPVVELALKAGEAILPFWRIGTAVTAKADDSPVTAADMAAHHLILAGLTALDPSIPVLSEEDANAATRRARSGECWRECQIDNLVSKRHR